MTLQFLTLALSSSTVVSSILLLKAVVLLHLLTQCNFRTCLVDYLPTGSEPLLLRGYRGGFQNRLWLTWSSPIAIWLKKPVFVHQMMGDPRAAARYCSPIIPMLFAFRIYFGCSEVALSHVGYQSALSVLGATVGRALTYVRHVCVDGRSIGAWQSTVECVTA